MRHLRLSLFVSTAATLVALGACTSDDPVAAQNAGNDAGIQVASTISFTVNPPGVELDVGTTGTITVTSATALPVPATLSVAGLPAGVSIGFAPAAITTTATATITVANDAVPGDYPITVVGQVAGASGSLPVTLKIKAPAVGFALSVNPNAAETSPGRHLALAVAIDRKGTFDGDVAVSLVAPPAGISAASITIPKGSNAGVLEVDIATSAALGDAALSIRGAAGEAVQDVPFALKLVAEPGATDPIVATELPVEFPYLSGAADAVRTADGGFVYAMQGSEATFLVKLTATGAVDPNFGPLIPQSTKKQGYLQVSSGYPRFLALQADGKFVVVVDSKIVRALADGSAVDTTFNGTGTVTVPSQINSLALDGDKVVVSGQPSDTGGQTPVISFPVRRYTSAGVADTTFNGTGLVTVVTPAYAYDHRITSAGTSLIVAYSASAGETQYDFYATKLGTNGAVDTTFGTAGRTAAIDFLMRSDTIRDVLVQGDGKILLLGNAVSGTYLQRYAVARLTATGQLDTTFGTGGKTLVGYNGDYANRGALQKDGKILLTGAGVYDTSPNQFVYTTRLLANGAIDASFGTDGRSYISGPTGSTYANGLRVYPDLDGKIAIPSIFYIQPEGGGPKKVADNRFLPFLARLKQ